MPQRRLLPLPLVLGLALLACSQPDQGLVPPKTGTPVVERALLPCKNAPWCWERGRPLVLAPGDPLVAFGPEGKFLRWVGDQWVDQSVPTGLTLTSVQVGPDETWVSDEQGGSWRWAGQGWEAQQSVVPIAKVFGAPDGSLWALSAGTSSGHGQSSGGKLLRFREVWVESIPTPEFCLGGSYLALERSEIWAAGLTCDAEGTVNAVEVRRWADGVWTLVGAPIPEQGWYPTLSRVGGQVQVEATGLFGWNGASWQTVERTIHPQNLGIEDEALWDGEGYTVVPRDLGCEQAVGGILNTAFCTGQGQIHMKVRASWVPTLEDTYQQTQTADRLNVVPTRLWAGGDTRVAWAAGPDDVYRARRHSAVLEHYDGQSWSAAHQAPSAIVAIRGGGADDLWFASEEGPVHFDGQTYESRPVPEFDLTWGRVALLAWPGEQALYSNGPVLYRWQGEWTEVYRTPENWYVDAIGGPAPDDLWMAIREAGRSNNAQLLHFDGKTWTPGESGAWAGSIIASDGVETWLHRRGRVDRLDAPGPNIPTPSEFWSELVVTTKELWLVADGQAARSPR
jgi:hypothetical protein